MSYRTTVTARRGELSDAVAAALAREAVDMSEPAIRREVQDHAQAAVVAVVQLAPAVGGPDDELYVEIEGHANPDHLPRAYHSPESLTVRVAVVLPEPPAPTVHNPSGQQLPADRARAAGDTPRDPGPATTEPDVSL